MTLILHIAGRDNWETARARGVSRAASPAAEGVIHGPTAEQVAGAADAFCAGRPDHVLLCIDTRRVRAEARFDHAPDHGWFPHIGGPLHVDTVIGVPPFAPGADGRFRLPPAIPSVLPTITEAG